ncbi:MAG: presqualene diphosphate synthase HpnD [Rhodospirillaceae bacterium]
MTAITSAQAHVVAVVRAAESSFSLGMRIMPFERRMAMFAIYAFCREVDNVADDGGTTANRLAELAQWRDEVSRLYAGWPTRPTTTALLEPVRRYDLPQSEFIAMIEGMEMDARESMLGPDMVVLMFYCRRVAGSVGLLSLPVFGASEPEAHNFALKLADALQLTNILRDIHEDAERGRLYLPREVLERHGIDRMQPLSALLRHPAMSEVFAEIVGLARIRYAEADAALLSCDRTRLRPALLMMGIYEAALEQLERCGWNPDAPTAKLSKCAKLWAALTRGLLRPKWQPST